MIEVISFYESGEPMMQHPIVSIYTDRGVIKVELFPEYAPNAVNSFLWAVREHIYENRVIRRVVPGFVLQPSYSYFEEKRCDFMIEGEFASNGVNNPLKMEKGTVAMAGDGAKLAHGCEFFITLSDEAGEKLQDRFTAFGKVISGYEEVERLEQVETVQLFPEGVQAVIRQPVEDEHMLRVEAETFGEVYPDPVVAQWC